MSAYIPRTLFLISLCIGFLSLSCRDKKEPVVPSPAPEVTATATVVIATPTPEPTLVPTPKSAKEETEDRLEQKLGALNVKITAMKEKVNASSSKKKKQLKKSVAVLEKDLKKVQHNFDALKQSSAKKWKTMRTGVEKSIKKLETATAKLAKSVK